MHKVKKLTLGYLPDHDHFQGKPFIVQKVQHTTDHLPGESLTKARVDELNISRHWDVTIVKERG